MIKDHFTFDLKVHLSRCVLCRHVRVQARIGFTNFMTFLFRVHHNFPNECLSIVGRMVNPSLALLALGDLATGEGWKVGLVTWGYLHACKLITT